ncbi:MAG: protein kinase [Candidatus Melainabacteria bacterium]|nr:protein kinase [Candidatus Melainabacteria bacterium]
MQETPQEYFGPDEKEAPSDGRLKVGALVDGRYEVLAHIGSGGMGEVYKVLDRQTRKFFALKMISPQLADKKVLAKRLEHEAQAARTLVHGNIVSVYDVGAAADGVPYLLMDYVEGDGLDVLLKTEAYLPQTRALPIFMQIAEALVHAQEKSIVHRDLKPSNILMTKTPQGNDMVKIVDFGIAKVSDQDGADKTKLTQTGELLGTPLYMSPEQCTGDELDERSDLYSFGCIMYEVLSGKSPFAAENSVKVILRHLNEEPAALPNNRGISADMKEVVARCLEKHRDNRYKNAIDLHIDLERIYDGKAIRPHARVHKKKESRKTFSKLAVASVVFIGVCVSLFSALIFFASLAPKQAAAPSGFQKPERYMDKTLTQWTNEIEKDPENPELYLNRGNLHSMRDERMNAVDDYTEALKLKPNYLQALNDRAFAYMMLAQYGKAFQDADKVIALTPKSAAGYARRGMIYQSCEMFPEAVADFERAIAIDGNNAYYLYSSAMSQVKLAHYADAEQQLQKAIEIGDRNGTYSANLGLVYTFQQKYPEAEECLRFDPNDRNARSVEWAQVAYYNLCVGKMDEAHKALEQMKARETFPARAFRMSGVFYSAAGQYEKAMQELTSSTSLEEYPPGYRQRAIAYINLGQARSALADLKKSHQLNPKSTITLSWLAQVENQLGMKKEAAQHIAQAFASKVVAPISYVNKATIELENGDAKAALADANAAVKQDKWLKEGYAIRAKAKQKLGDSAGAEADEAEANKLISHYDL